MPSGASGRRSQHPVFVGNMGWVVLGCLLGWLGSLGRAACLAWVSGCLLSAFDLSQLSPSYLRVKRRFVVARSKLAGYELFSFFALLYVTHTYNSAWEPCAKSKCGRLGISSSRRGLLQSPFSIIYLYIYFPVAIDRACMHETESENRPQANARLVFGRSQCLSGPPATRCVPRLS